MKDINIRDPIACIYSHGEISQKIIIIVNDPAPLVLHRALSLDWVNWTGDVVGGGIGVGSDAGACCVNGQL